MPHIGTFTAAMEEASEEPTTFTLDGEGWSETFEVVPLSAHAFLKFSRIVGEIDVTDPEQVGAANMVVMFDLLRDAISEEDWERFEDTVREHRVGLGTVLSVASAIMEGSTGFPTEQGSDSGGSAPTASPRSRPKSSDSRRGRQREQVAARSATVRAQHAVDPNSTAAKIAAMRPVEPGDERIIQAAPGTFEVVDATG